MQITAIGKGNYSSFAPFLEGAQNEAHGYLGVIKDGAAIAAAEFAIEAPVLIVKDIYVDPDHRRQGAAKLLLEEAAKTAASVGIHDVLAYYGDEEAATSFYKSLGFTCFPSDVLYSIPMGAIFSLKQYQAAKKKGIGKNILRFDSLTPQQKNKLISAITDQYDFTRELFAPGSYNANLSLVYMPEAGRPKGIIMAGADKWDVYVTACAVSGGDQKMAFILLAAFVLEVEKYFIPDSNLYFLGRNEQLVQSLSSIFGDKMKKITTGWSAIKSIRE